MRHLAAVAAVAAEAVACRRSAKAEDLGLAARIKALAGRVVRRRVQVAQETPGVPVVLVAPETTAAQVDPGVPAVPATTVVRAGLAVRVAPATTAAPADPATSAAPETTAVLAVPATSGRDRATPSAASAASRGAMEQHRGAGGHHHVPDGADRSLPRAESGTKDRSTTGASRNNRYGTGTKTVGASGSSESGSRCNEPVGWGGRTHFGAPARSHPTKADGSSGSCSVLLRTLVSSGQTFQLRGLRLSNPRLGLDVDRLGQNPIQDSRDR